MTPKFQQVIDPLLCTLIDLVQRSDRMSIEELKVELTREFDIASNFLEIDPEWLYCKYAMVAWVDSEVMVNHKMWKDNTLEAHYFKMGNAFTEFFLRAQKAYEKRYFNAFEVFYICFMFGYHGVYQISDRTIVPKTLPPTDVEWQVQAAKRLVAIKQEPKESWVETRDVEPEQGPLIGFSSFVNNLVFFLFVMLFLLVAILYFRN